MKKLFFLLMAFMAVTVISCNKEPNGKEDDTPKGPQFRIKTLSYCDGENLAKPEDAGWFDTWTYTYDAQGRVTEVDRGSDSNHWTFAYADNKVTVNRKDGKEVYELTLNSDGVCTSILDDVKESDWGAYKETATFEYDATLRPIKISKEGELRSVITLRDNCLVSWTKERDNRKRTFTYNTTKNVGDLHAIYSEAIDPPARWMYETGLFGKGPEYLPATSVWEDDPENGSTITCEVDANGYCTSEKKVFPGGWTEYFVITWEKIE